MYISRLQLDKLTSVLSASVLLLMMINSVITMSKWLWNHETQASGSTVNFENVMTIRGKIHNKSDVNLVFTITVNC